MRLAAVVLAVLALPALPTEALEGIVLLPDGTPAADATVSILGQPGSTRTGHDGRFTWAPDPRLPFEVLVILPGGVYASPVLIEALPAGGGPVPVRLRATVSEAITVSAGATPHTEAPPASAAAVVVRQDLEQRRPANLAEALEGIPGVGRQEEGLSAVPSIRGLSRGRTLILVDGGRVTAERRAGPSATFLDPFFLEAIEISRGLGSVAYGSDAFGGIIHARTRQAVPGSPLAARVQGTLGAGLPERSVGLEVTRGLEEGGVILQGRFRSFGDYRSPGGRVDNSAARDGGLRARLDREWGRGKLHLGWASDLGRDIGKPATDSGRVRSFYPREDSHRLTLGYDPDPVAGFTRLTAQSFLGYYRLVTDRDSAPAPPQGREVGRSDVRAWDYGLRLSGARSFSGLRLEGGVDLNGRAGLRARGALELYDLAGTLRETAGETSIEEAGRRDLGLYLSADAMLLRHLTGAAGLRVDHTRAVNRGGFFGDHRSAHGATSGFLALTAGPLASLTLTGQAGWGFRDPTLSDRFFRGVSGRGFVTGLPTLDPERSLQYELALRRAGRVRAAVYLYRYRISDLVERYRAGDDFFFRNRGRVLIRGAELEAQADLGAGWRAEVGLQAAAGQALDDRSQLADVPPEGLVLTVRKVVAGRGHLLLRSVARSRDDDPGPTELATPGYATLEAGAGWRLRAGLEARLSVRNLLDHAHPGSADETAVLAPGRSVLFTLAAVF